MKQWKDMGIESTDAELARAAIIELLLTNDRAVERALVLLFNRQTRSEQASGQTYNLNGRGFNANDAEIFTSFVVNTLHKGRHLSAKQLAVCRKPTRKGNGIRIGKYWRQLKEEAEAKATRRAAVAA